MKKRYCGPCDDLVIGNPCPECGADTETWPIDAEPLEPLFRGREASACQRETQARIQRELK